MTGRFRILRRRLKVDFEDRGREETEMIRCKKSSPVATKFLYMFVYFKDHDIIMLKLFDICRLNASSSPITPSAWSSRDAKIIYNIKYEKHDGSAKNGIDDPIMSPSLPYLLAIRQPTVCLTTP